MNPINDRVKNFTGTVIRVNYNYSSGEAASKNYTITVVDNETHIPYEVYPYDVHNLNIPLPGENVYVISSINPTQSPDQIISHKRYYLNPLTSFNTINSNVIPPYPQVNVKSNSNNYSNVSSDDLTLPDDYQDEDTKTFTERGDILPLQLYPGDIAFQGRYGHSIRFGTTPKSSDGAYKELKWTSGEGEPIIVIRNGQPKTLNPQFNELIVEDINKDGSSIYLTSKQKVSIETQNLHSDTSAVGDYNRPQVIANAERVVINSKADDVVISSAKNISLATPNWKTTLDKLMEVVEGLAQQLADLSSGKATFATGTGPTGPSTNTLQLQQILLDVKQLKNIPTIALRTELTTPRPAFIQLAEGNSVSQRLASTSQTPIASSTGQGLNPNADATTSTNGPNANRLRQTLNELGSNYVEKGIEIDNGGDISSQMERAASAVFRKIAELHPELRVRVTGGNDAFHQKLGYVSRHTKGNAIDFTVAPATGVNLDKVVRILNGYAAGNYPNFRFIDEYRRLTSAGTANHFHMSWGQGTESQSTINNAKRLADNGQIDRYVIS